MGETRQLGEMDYKIDFGAAVGIWRGGCLFIRVAGNGEGKTAARLAGKGEGRGNRCRQDEEKGTLVFEEAKLVDTRTEGEGRGERVGRRCGGRLRLIWEGVSGERRSEGLAIFALHRAIARGTNISISLTHINKSKQ